ncbi:MAG TPA: hypothetical protein VE994_06800 [Terriglobales bacterium]|nr:hypothetical protein [Terriglobales bacterium]
MAEELMGEMSGDNLRSVATNPGLTEDLALLLLNRSDLPAAVLDELARNPSAMQSHRVRSRVACHPHTPRHLAINVIRQLYTFELMQVALAPTALPEVIIAAEQAILMRLDKIAAGERITLGHRGSTRIAGALLLDGDPRVIEAALDNGRLTEDFVLKAIMSPKASPVLLELVSHHAKWSLRADLREALLRNEKLPVARALELAKLMPVRTLREILHDARLRENVRTFLEKEVQKRSGT